ncbi:hypothetical protein SALBM135S_01058 [Streptomyces alboniger]
MALPALRGDYRAIETYSCPADRKVRCALTVLTGKDDPLTTVEEAERWQDHADGPFRVRVFDGGHFFLTQHLWRSRPRSDAPSAGPARRGFLTPLPGRGRDRRRPGGCWSRDRRTPVGAVPESARRSRGRRITGEPAHGRTAIPSVALHVTFRSRAPGQGHPCAHSSSTTTTPSPTTSSTTCPGSTAGSPRSSATTIRPGGRAARRVRQRGALPGPAPRTGPPTSACARASPTRRLAAGARRLPGPPGHGAGPRRAGGPCARAAPRPDLRRAARRHRSLRGAAAAAGGRPLPLPRGDRPATGP